MNIRRILKRASILAVLLAVAIVPVPVSATDPQPGYTDCMNRAINHKYADIAAGTSYADAHEHYLYHTQQCYERFWANYNQ